MGLQVKWMVVGLLVFCVKTWKEVKVRQCECNERIAEIETPGPPNVIGFSK